MLTTPDMIRTYLLLLCVLLTHSCAKKPSKEVSIKTPAPEQWAQRRNTFGKYWHAGKAELSRYVLKQERYGEVHEGEAVLIFVTEPFLADKQVKHEHGELPSVPIIKLNHARRFYTGIYPYNVLTSVFSPEDSTHEIPIKVSSSIQEWCGHAYTQFNNRTEHWQMTQHSYFQDEADSQVELPIAQMEDHLFIRLRQDPKILPVGSFKMIPALHYLRFKHIKAQAYNAVGKLEEGEHKMMGSLKLPTYTLRYPELGRELRIWFSDSFPYVIHAWEEKQQGSELRTTAIRTKGIISDYWNHNKSSDQALREVLGVN